MSRTPVLPLSRSLTACPHCCVCWQSLMLLRELLRFGSDRVVEETRDHMYNLRTLDRFYHQEDGKERGNGNREIERKIRELTNDEKKLRRGREEPERNGGKNTARGSPGNA